MANPADSRIGPAPNCGFYQWSEQMFLWLTSPAPPAYGGGANIFDSPAFFDVSPPDASGNRTFLAHAPGFIHAFPLWSRSGARTSCQSWSIWLESCSNSILRTQAEAYRPRSVGQVG